MTARSPRSSRAVLPLANPDRTVALWLVRCSDDPDDPLRITLDYTLLDQLGWRPGDRITFEPIDLDRHSRQGGLVVRQAHRDEPAIKLRRDHYQRKIDPYARHFPDSPNGPDGPDIEWPCPPEWIETFFPMEYIPGPGSPIFIEPDKRWLLRDLLDQRERLVVRLGCSRLEFRLQRTDPAAPTLDVHLPPGVLHLMGWSPATPLALTSGSGFDPATPEDLLTIRQAAPGETNLPWDGGKFIASPNPAWLERYFPGLHDNTKEDTRPDSSTIPAGLDDSDLVKFPSQLPPDRAFSLEDQARDTFCVHFSDFRLGPESLAFAIPETSEFWE